MDSDRAWWLRGQTWEPDARCLKPALQLTSSAMLKNPLNYQYCSFLIGKMGKIRISTINGQLLRLVWAHKYKELGLVAGIE